MQYAQAFMACRTFTIKWKQSFATLEKGVVCFMLSFPMDCRQANNWMISVMWRRARGELPQILNPGNGSLVHGFNNISPSYICLHTRIVLLSCLLWLKADVIFVVSNDLIFPPYMFLVFKLCWFSPNNNLLYTRSKNTLFSAQLHYLDFHNIWYFIRNCLAKVAEGIILLELLV